MMSGGENSGTICRGRVGNRTGLVQLITLCFHFGGGWEGSGEGPGRGKPLAGRHRAEGGEGETGPR